MNYKLIEKEAFTVMGKGMTVSLTDGENNWLIPLFWNASNQNGLTKALGKAAGPMGLLGVCMPFDTLQEQFTYLIAAEKTSDEPLADTEVIEIPAATWAVFEAIGPMPHAIQNVWERIYSEWFPSTGYEHAAAPELEVYLDGNVNDPDYRSEIWIPIIKK
jgi:AraC family transcriptional regulator